MIRVAHRSHRRNERRFALVGSAILMILAYLALRAAAVPAFTSSRTVIRKLDPLLFQRYATAPSSRAPEPARPLEEPARATPELDEAVGSAMQQLDAFFSAGVESDPGAPSPRDEAAAALALDETIGGGGDAFESLFGTGGGVSAPPGARARTRRGSVAEGPGLALAPPASSVAGGIPARTEPALSVELPEPAVSSLTEAPPSTPSPARAPAAEVDARFSGEEFRRSEVAILGDWMEANASDLPPGVKVHLKYQTSYLTATARFSHEGRDVEFFLMLNPAVEELHIVLVEADRSIYLVDRGLTAQSRSLREGTVRRLDGQIVAVDSRGAAADEEKSRDFYTLFLTWWEKEKTHVPH